QVMLATVERQTGESVQYKLGLEETLPDEIETLVAAAKAELDGSIASYEAMAEQLEQMQLNSVLSYTLYGLGLAQNARADLVYDYLYEIPNPEEFYKEADGTLQRC